MKILVIADYPRSSHPWAGIFNERSVRALKESCDRVEVMSPRPYVPPFLSSIPRWKLRAVATSYESRDGISVFRPAYLYVPRIGAAFWYDQGAFLCCRRTARNMHRRVGFDAIVSFGLIGPGGIAWRLGRDLGIPASGWATGGDLHRYAGTSVGRVALRAIERLDLNFYQSRELLQTAARLRGISSEMVADDKHVVLSRGIPEPPSLSRKETRHRVRSTLGIRDDQVLVVNVGSIYRAKGVFELLEAISLAVGKDSRITCVIVGSIPAFDETDAVQKKLVETPGLKDHVKIVPACSPDKVWEYLCAADMFAFPSHAEGMPNSLLEAMAMGVPAIAFAIPPVLEIEAGTEALLVVPAFDSALFSEGILRLAISPEERIRIGSRGKTQIIDRFMLRKNMAKALQLLERMIAANSVSDSQGGKSEMFGEKVWNSSS